MTGRVVLLVLALAALVGCKSEPPEAAVKPSGQVDTSQQAAVQAEQSSK